ncbi:MAG: DUF4215 domain-containing protein [Deltaproteobacteria bacterium]|nr:DUF4215 domain-containing protein [Deltaproteobacteria bacterium]
MKILISMLFGLIVFAPMAKGEMVLRYESTSRGTLAVTGNTLGLSKQHDENGPGTEGSIGTFITTDTSLIDDAPTNPANPWPFGTTSNWTRNNSEAVLDLPIEGTVVYAELIWGGSYQDIDEDVIDSIDTPIHLSHELGDELEVSPDPLSSATLDMISSQGFGVKYYIRSADVTAFVTANGRGTYTIGGVPATQGFRANSLNCAGWTLVVVVEDSSLAMKNISIKVGAEWVDEDNPTDVHFDNLCLPPSGLVTGRLVLSAMEGDADIDGNELSIAESTGDTFESLYSDNNPIDNFFASQINDVNGLLDTRGSLGQANHDALSGTHVSGGRQGWDVTGVSLGSENGQLVNNQTSAVVRGSSFNDTYVLSLVGLETDIDAPSISLNATATPEVVFPGEHVTFTIDVSNEAWRPDAEHFLLFVLLPPDMLLVGFSIDGQAGDVEGNPVLNADLASGVLLGNIEGGIQKLVEIHFRVGSIPESPSPVTLETNILWDYQFSPCPPTTYLVEGSQIPSPLLLTAPRLETALTIVPESGAEAGAPIPLMAQIAFSNSGTANIEDMTLRVAFSQGVEYVAQTTLINESPQADEADGTLIYTTDHEVHDDLGQAGTISTGSAATVEFRLTAPADATSVTLFAFVDPDGPGPQSPEPHELSISLSPIEPECGNHIQEDGETCDDGNLTDGDGCDSSCQLEEPECGNHTVEDGETCDDGNLTDGDGCDASCQLEEPECGNHTVEDGETCDDGNLTDGDGCDASCQLEEPKCGNQILEDGETCDDGNLTDGDGCDSTCRLEEDPADPEGESGCSCGIDGPDASPTATSMLLFSLLGLFILRRRLMLP